MQTNVPVLILHCGTNAHLGSDRNVYNNDYGKVASFLHTRTLTHAHTPRTHARTQEFELFCKTCNDAMKGQLGTRDKKLVS